MPRVTVHLPRLLGAVAGERDIAVEAETLRGALDALVKNRPALQVHLFDETGAIRQHVLCFHNETNVRWLPGLEIPVAAGDSLTIVQAVSGG
jgi:molybdopterin converting factor small subunit